MPCTDRNPLKREGTSQLNRVLAALDVHFADVDERNISDLIQFAKRYASYLKYYKDGKTVTGDWQPFMMMDVSVTLATLAKINIQGLSDYKKACCKNIALAINYSQPTRDRIAKQQFKYLFDALFSIVKIVDNQLKLLPEEDYKKIIEEIIKSKLRLHLANLGDKFFESFKPVGLLDYSTLELDNSAPFEIESDKNFNRSSLSGVWQAIVPDIEITIPALTDDHEKIVYIINHNLFNSTVDSLIKNVASITSRAEELFKKTIVDFPGHTPHYALFLAFAKLFKSAQDDLNRYSKRHLDFYFKDVLQLSNKIPLPDTAHLTFELQKPILQQLLKKETLFKGGKDITGKEINYRLTDDVVLNKAAVVKIQAQQIGSKTGKSLKAFPIASSEDGEGAKLLSSDKSWFAFGNEKSNRSAKAGFAIASNILFLNEGVRIITVTIAFENSIPGLTAPGGKRSLACFNAELTGKKEWLAKSFTSVVYNGNDKQIIFTIRLEANEPAIIPCSEKIHRQNIGVTLPILKIYLNQDANDAIPYSVLCKQRITGVKIDIAVTGVKDLMLSNDSGSIDASKPFKPFGDFPRSDSSFYLGSKEIFQKSLTYVELDFDWKSENAVSSSDSLVKSAEPIIPVEKESEAMGEIAAMDVDFYKKFKGLRKRFEADYSPAKGEYLNNGNWNNVFLINKDKIDFGPSQSFTKTAVDFEKNAPFSATAFEGFLRLKFDKSGYSLEDHLNNLSAQLSKSTIVQDAASTTPKYNITIAPAPVPDDIVLNSFSVNYGAAETIDISSEKSPVNNLLLHLTPFGFYRVQPDIPGTEPTEKITLVPDIINDGELFIGFENAAEDLVINVLFQVAEGSSNPLLNMETINWYYLARENFWKPFEKQFVIDRTNNFTQSGIVTFTLPHDISNQNTILEKGLHWIKAAVEKNIYAVCRMILIQAQAASVELVQDDAGQVEFRKIIAANSISKLVESNAAVKTITQPFDGFSGRTRESDEHFYVRVSERLRHKQRTISIWDYEHILLEQFPQLYKVKCLNHTGFYGNNGVNVYSENFPGHVTIIPVPDLKNNTHANRLKPYTPIGLLNNISEYLKRITSPFVKLHVNNPQFEEIRLEFKVKFYDNLDEKYYTQLLNEEIEKFLCPWAFGAGVEIPFGSKITKSVLLNFVEERPYVDFLTCFEMHHLLRGTETDDFEQRNVEEAVATTSRSVLVSYYDESNCTRHIINTPASCNC